MTEIDTEALGESVDQGVKSLLNGGWEKALMTILFALVILAVCLIVKRIMLKILDRGLDRSHVEKSFHAFIRSGLNIVLWFITIMIVAESLGIKATSLLALVSIAGLAVSLSVQDTLANLAGGLTILSTQPFKVGDYVEIGSTGGTVQEIGMVYTKLTTLDNRRIVVPNSTVSDAQVTNYTTEPIRRVDLTVSASYDAPVEKVKAAVQSVAADHEKVLLDPAPFVRLTAYGDSALDYAVRVWCENADYWDVYHDMLEGIKAAFDREGISIPYPQVEVSLRRGK
ncbi:MAG: mechanosensitive ion channel family protein [Clostridiales bacterium]|nr:mechanosensitive ion channel family protein [Clostridiales bacterium]